MIFNEIDYFTKRRNLTGSKQIKWKDYHDDHFTDHSRNANLREFLSIIPSRDTSSSSSTSSSSKRRRGYMLYSTIICASLKSNPMLYDISHPSHDPPSDQVALRVPKVFIDNLPPGIDEDDLSNSFKRCGSVSKLWLYKGNILYNYCYCLC